MLLVGFKSTYQKRFNQKMYLGKNLAVKVVHFCYRHASLKRERIFLWIAIFTTTKTIFMLQIKKKVKCNVGIKKKLQAYQTLRRK